MRAHPSERSPAGRDEAIEVGRSPEGGRRRESSRTAPEWMWPGEEGAGEVDAATGRAGAAEAVVAARTARVAVAR